MKKNIRDYLNLSEEEKRLLEAYDNIPEDLLPFFERMLFGNSKDFDQAMDEVLAIVEVRKKYQNK